ncbi:MAG TPA: carbohydrate-binding protein [bacterium]|nr:carbohydrate-binding protein [bacterium]HPN42627.1 carbohydrate-binding protein [bacterium]
MRGKTCFIVLTLSAILYQTNCNKPEEYIGKPFADAVYTGGPQTIPGIIQCEYYDFGGEGIAYHDDDFINSGSGVLNPADGSYLHEFRKEESVDISYTKFTVEQTDNSPFNLVNPGKDQHYVGWTSAGEWVKYTVNVTRSGKYKIGLLYTSRFGGQISFQVNDKPGTGPIELPQTYNPADTVQWRQWHHWNYLGDLAHIELKKGIQVITLSILTQGLMNFEHFEFTRLE